eukprot:TRINITY_DN13204_c0_g4_i1.p1 TRINITY_DN13204_c0_g4~~TRINITY_DN13204_c0_g4_i1.p1  ORF type:complete len:291 (-),score=22.58 TRINITY_DN13204_c0_g4_i1:79-918(-)
MTSCESWATSENSSLLSFGARSEGGASQSDSQVGAPRWDRLVKGAAASLTQRISKVVDEPSDVEWQVFVVPDACGGGTENDVYQCFKLMLEEIDLNEVDTGVVLIGAYHFLSEIDLPLSCQTWRGLTFTALLASLRIATVGAQRTKSSEQMLSRVAHWWPREKAEHACSFFTNRHAFKNNRLTASKHAEYYFTLRATGLQMGGWDSCSTASAAHSLELSDITVKGGDGMSGRNKPNSGSTRNSEESNMHSEDSPFEMFGRKTNPAEPASPQTRSTKISL